jgi:translocation and assembly module TamB
MRRVLKLAVRGLLAIGTTAIVLLGALWMAGNSDAGRGWIEALTYRLTGGMVRLEGLKGAFPGNPTLERLEIRDRGGIWLTAEHISASWTPFALLERRIVVGELSAARVHMERLPPGDGKGGGGGLPYIEVTRFDLGTVELGAALAGSKVSLSARGGLTMRSATDASGDLQAHRTDGEGDYVLHLRADSQRMDASLAVHEPAHGPLQNLLSMPGLGALSVALELAGPRSAVRTDAKLEAGALHGQAHGSIDLVRSAAAVDFSLSSAAMAPSADLSWDRLELQGTWRGAPSDLAGHGVLDVDGLRLPGGLRIQRLSAKLTAARGRLDAGAVVNGLQVPGPQPRILAADPVKMDASLRLDQASRPLQFTASHPLFSLRARADLGASPTEQFRSSVELRLADVAPFAALAAQDARGEALISGQFTHAPDADSINLEAYLGLTGGTAPWIALAGPRANLRLAGSISSSTIQLQNLRVVGSAAILTASGSAARATAGPAQLPVSELQSKWRIQIADLSRFSTAVAGDLEVSGELNGPPLSIAASAQAVSHLSIGGSEPGTVQASLRLRGLPQSPGGSVRAHGTLDGAPLDLDATLDRGADRTYRLVVRQGRWKSARADGDITTDAGLTQSRGQMRLEIGQIGDFSRVLRTEVSGSVRGTLGFEPADGHTEAHVELQGGNLVVGQLSGDLQLEGRGVSSALNLQLAGQLPRFYGMPAGVSASGTLDLDAHKLSLLSLSANYRTQNFHLQGPAVLSFAQGLSVDRARIGAQKAVFEIAGQFAPSLDLHASLLHVDSDLVNVFAPGFVTDGVLEAQARLQGSASSPTGSVTLDVHDLRFAFSDETANALPAVDIHAQAQLAGDSATVDAKLSGGPSSQLTASGELPLNADGALDLAIGGKMDAGLVNPLLEARGMRAAGQLTVDATVTGSAAKPLVGGGIRLAAGSLRDYGRGLYLSDISAEVLGMEGGLRIKSFVAKAASGNVAVTGTLAVLQHGMPVDLKIAAKNAQPIASSIVTANLDADLRITGNALERVDLAGKIHVNRANIGIPDSLPPEVAVLDVRRRGNRAAGPAGGKLVVGVAVVIEAPQEILVQGRGLDSELGGEITLSGTSQDLLAAGGFDLLRGSFTIAGNKLSFTQGRVGFDGAGLRKKIDPTLDFTAETNVADATVTLHITGVADAPRFEFTSNPALPQDEIMARLLFGESAAQLSALQVAQIGAALATLTGVGGGDSNPLVKLQKSLGLDRLTVGANPTTSATGAVTNNGAAIEAGRYVGKRVYVEAKQSTAGTSQLLVDVDLTKHLKLQTRLGNGTAAVQGTTPENDPGSAVGISYQFEY